MVEQMYVHVEHVSKSFRTSAIETRMLFFNFINFCHPLGHPHVQRRRLPLVVELPLPLAPGVWIVSVSSICKVEMNNSQLQQDFFLFDNHIFCALGTVSGFTCRCTWTSFSLPSKYFAKFVGNRWWLTTMLTTASAWMVTVGDEIHGERAWHKRIVS